VNDGTRSAIGLFVVLELTLGRPEGHGNSCQADTGNARRPIDQIADEIQRVTASADVMVVGKGQHLCMSMRGIKTDAVMANSVVRGRFRYLPALRAEALSLMGL
jgi:hypothetical protein